MFEFDPVFVMLMFGVLAMAINRMAVGCCCGAADCYEKYTTDFPDQSTFDSEWTEVSGTWSITGGKLRCTGAGIVEYDTANASPDAGAYLSVKMTKPGTAQDWQVRLWFRSGSSNYYNADFDCGAPIDISDGGFGSTTGDDCDIGSGAGPLELRLCVNSTISVGEDITGSIWGDGDPVRGSHHITGAFGTPATGYKIRIEVVDLGSNANIEFEEVTWEVGENGARPSPTTEECMGCCVTDQIDFSPNGSNWTQVSGGSWTLPGDGYADNGNTNALCVYNGETEREYNGVELRLDIAALSTNDIARIVINYEDSDNYHFMEITKTGSAEASLELFERSGGTETSLRSDTERTFSGKTVVGLIMFDDGLLVGWIGQQMYNAVPAIGNTISYLTATEHSDGKSFGFGAGGTLTGDVSWEAGASFIYQGSPYCWRDNLTFDGCLDADNTSGAWPEDLDITVTGVSNSSCSTCSNLNTTYTVTRLPDTPHVWRYDFSTAECNYDYLEVTITYDEEADETGTTVKFVEDVFLGDQLTSSVTHSGKLDCSDATSIETGSFGTATECTGGSWTLKA